MARPRYLTAAPLSLPDHAGKAQPALATALFACSSGGTTRTVGTRSTNVTVPTVRVVKPGEEANNVTANGI
jgi:hypothetical protein